MQVLCCCALLYAQVGLVARIRQAWGIVIAVAVSVKDVEVRILGKASGAMLHLVKSARISSICLQMSLDCLVLRSYGMSLVGLIPLNANHF